VEAVRERVAQLEADDWWLAHAGEAAPSGNRWTASPVPGRAGAFCEYELAERGIRPGGYIA
jgi:hypothetical protein